MSTDTPEHWNDHWADMEDYGSGSDEILADQIKNLKIGRALEIGCGTGGNAVWLAKQGWQVTAVDYSVVAIERGMRLAAEAGVDIEFIEADASKFQPRGHYDLITCFYIQLFPQQRADMLANMSKALAQGGTLLFVSHDKSKPPPGWSREDMQSLTTPEEIVAELSGLQVEQASVLDHAESCHASSYSDDEKHEPHEHQDSWESSSTIVRATQPVT